MVPYALIEVRKFVLGDWKDIRESVVRIRKNKAER